MGNLSWRKVNAYKTIFYAVLIPLAIYTGWIYSVAFISVLSLVALVEGSLSAWRSDVPIEEEDE